MLYLGVILIGSIALPGFAHMMILFTSSGFSGAQAAFSFMPGAIADLTGSYAPAYIVFTLFAIFTLAGRPVDLPTGAPERRLSAVCLRRKRGFP